MKRVILLLVVVLTTVVANAQNSITATVVDAKSREGVVGAVVEFAPADTTAQKRYFTTGYRGRLEASVPQGSYTMSISFLGYETLQQQVKVTSRRALGTLELSAAATEIEAVVKEVKSMRTSQKGDTVSYNAGAFKVTADADVEGLLKKMPGITVSNGSVEAQGETVKKVYVDGKEFFGEDVTSAIKSMPAQAVDRVEVYDKLSDAAEFSGMDDGEGFKAINIVTKPHMRQGQFGKLYAGYGYQPETEGMTSHHKYNAGGNVNIFQGSSRVSVIGLFNNVNQQNFSFEDILGVAGGNTGRGSGVGDMMVRPESGVASVSSFGVNYSDSWGKTGRNDKVTLQASYFFNRTNTKNRSLTDKWYEAPMAIDTMHNEGYTNNKNGNHRFNARLDWRISENQSLMSRTGLSYQSYDPYSTTTGYQQGESGYGVVNNYSHGDRYGVNFNQYLSYRTKLGKNGRTLTLDGRVTYRNNRGDTESYSNQASLIHTWRPDTLSDDDLLELRYQLSHAPSYSYNVRGDVTYTEPVSKYAQVSLQYRVGYNYQQSDKSVYVTGDDYLTAGIEPDPSLSKSSNSGYLTQRVGPGFRYAKGKNRFVMNVSYQHAQLTGEVLSGTRIGEGNSKTKQGFDNLTYFMMGQLNINKENSIRIFINSSTDNPSISQLQNIYDISNVRMISKGNADLKPSYSNNVRFHYVNSNVEKGRTFMWMFSMQNTSDYIASAIAQNVTLNIPTGSYNTDGTQEIKSYTPNQYSTYTNMDGYWNLRTQISYGFPISFIKCNLNLMTGVDYSITPTRVGGSVDTDGNLTGGERNDASCQSYDFRAILGSNISENVDFTLSWQGAYNIAKNSLSTTTGNNRYFNHTASASMKFVFLKTMTFTGNVSYQQYIGFTNNYDTSYVLCNLYLGKKVFRNRRGEVMIGVNDLLNQNTAFARTTGSGYTQNAVNSVIGRYYTVQFVYNLRNFGKRGSKNIRDYDGMERSERKGNGERPMGPPPGEGGHRGPGGGFGGPGGGF